MKVHSAEVKTTSSKISAKSLPKSKLSNDCKESIGESSKNNVKASTSLQNCKEQQQNLQLSVHSNIDDVASHVEVCEEHIYQFAFEIGDSENTLYCIKEELIVPQD